MVTYKRVQKFYTIIIPDVPARLSEDDFTKTKLDKPRHPYSLYKDRIKQVEMDARQVLMSMREFTFPDFEKLYFEPAVDQKNLFKALEANIDELKQQGRVGTASSYKCTLSSLKKFKDEKGIYPQSYEDVSVQFLNSWEKWMTSNGIASATIGIYCRNIRTILNKAKAAGLLKPENYPFGLNKFEIPASQNVKKALTVSDVGKIFNYPAKEGSAVQYARDLWIFSYLCNGINIKDIARLKYQNIDREAITFVRAKTERKLRKNQKSIVVPVTTEIKAIIKRWGNKLANKDSYVFPILTGIITPERERALVQQATKTTNKYIKRIAAELKINKPVTTYTARHSFATVMKRSGASIEFISESLGHSNLATTENYLASFEMETKRKFAKNLLKF